MSSSTQRHEKSTKIITIIYRDLCLYGSCDSQGISTQTPLTGLKIKRVKYKGFEYMPKLVCDFEYKASYCFIIDHRSLMI